MSMGVGDFFKVAAGEMAGVAWDPHEKAFTGWGRQFGTGTAPTMAPTGAVAGSKGWSHAGSAFRTALGAPLAAYYGYTDAGIFGAANGIAAEFVTSGIVGSAAIAGVGAGTQMLGIGLGGSGVGYMAGSLVGSAVAGPAGAAVLGPWGGAAGAWAAKQIAVNGIRATATAALSNPYGWAIGLAAVATLAVAAGAYATVRGSYELLKNGYAHKQKMRHKIDTAGSTAAFMSKNAFTMRSRAVAAIQKNHMNVKSAIGHEASAVHFSAYKKWSGGRLY